jgi:hypothetical protein
MQVQIGQDITSQLIDPAGSYDRMGARVEVPITGAIISPWSDATLSGGVWTVVCDGVIDPPGPGDYLLYWMTPDDPPSFREPLPLTVVPVSIVQPAGVVPDFPPLDPAQVVPTVDQVASLERTRTIEDSGDEVFTFDSGTRPTNVEVENLIEQAVPAVCGSLRAAFPTRYYPDVQHLVCLYTAILLEGSYFREQVSTEGAMSVWRTLYTTSLTALQGQIEYDLKQWRMLQRMEPPFTERREPWQRVGWNPGAIP